MPVCNKQSDVSDRHERSRTAETTYLRSRYGVTVRPDGRTAHDHGAHLSYSDLQKQFSEKPNADVITRFVSDDAERACRDQWLAQNAGKKPSNPTKGNRIFVSTVACRESIGAGLDRTGRHITGIRLVMGVYRWEHGRWHEVVMYPRHTRMTEFKTGYLHRALVAINPHVARTETESREILQLFLSDEAGRKEFATGFEAMMHDDTRSFVDKYDRFVGDIILEEAKARKALENVWLLAFGTPWNQRETSPR